MKPMVWITVLRGLFVLALGAAMLTEPDRFRPMVVNFMGIFFFVSGLVGLSTAHTAKEARVMTLLVGGFGVLAGAAILVRSVLSGLIPDTAVMYLLATVVLATGVMHMRSGFRSREDYRRAWSWLNFVLGLLEAGLGLQLFLAPLERGTALHVLICAWALFAGAMLLTDARRIRARASTDLQP